MSLVSDAIEKLAQEKTALSQSLQGIDWSKTPRGEVDLSRLYQRVLKKRKPIPKSLRGASMPKPAFGLDPKLKPIRS